MLQLSERYIPGEQSRRRETELMLSVLHGRRVVCIAFSPLLAIRSTSSVQQSYGLPLFTFPSLCYSFLGPHSIQAPNSALTECHLYLHKLSGSKGENFVRIATTILFVAAQAVCALFVLNSSCSWFLVACEVLLLVKAFHRPFNVNEKIQLRRRTKEG